MLVGITGVKRAGKDTAALPLKQIGFQQLSFATLLKKWSSEVLSGIGYSDDEVYEFVHGSRKEEIIPHFGKTTRELMQTLGTEWGRTFYDNLWVDLTLLPTLQGVQDYVISDVRFHNECDRIRELGGIVIRITRPGLETNEFSLHESEVHIPKLRVTHDVVNDGDEKDLRGKVLQIVLQTEKTFG